MKPGIYLVHKALGETSFSLVRVFIQELAAEGPRKRVPVCHGGALDPFAEGLMLLLVGQATRLMSFIHVVPKTYIAEVGWGAETDNGDLWGGVVFQGDVSHLTPARLDAVLAPFVGWGDQVPPSH